MNKKKYLKVWDYLTTMNKKKYIMDLIFVVLFLGFLRLINVDFNTWLFRLTVLLPCTSIVVAGGLWLYRITKKPKQ